MHMELSSAPVCILYFAIEIKTQFEQKQGLGKKEMKAQCCAGLAPGGKKWYAVSVKEIAMELFIKRFYELSVAELYEILQLRCNVFVVEQNCVYSDLDDYDQDAWHVYLRDEDGIQAYLRVLNRGTKFDDVSIGRVISMKRRCGLGTRILQAGIRVAWEKLSAQRITIEAQVYARGLYEKLGFVQASGEFLEDGIAHIRMTLEMRSQRSVFLTSSPCDDDVPEGVDLPCIFFERNGFVENLRQRIRPGGRFLVVAADPDAHALNDEMAHTFAECFRYHGMEFSEIMLLDSRTEAFAAQMVSGSNVILLGGGHVPTESAFFNRIGLKILLKDFQGVVMGVSAGSMNCASIVYAQPECSGESLDPYYRRFIPGLGLCDTMVLPHYQKERFTILDGRRLYEDITYADSFGREFIAIPDGSYVLVENGGARLFGEGYRIAEGNIQQICGEEESAEL